MMNANSFARLDSVQKSFILKKVRELKTMDAVRAHYSKPCLVAKYALSVARKEFKNAQA